MEPTIGLSERWLVIGDITSSSKFQYVINRKIKNPDKRFDATVIYKQAIDSMFITVQKHLINTSNLVNTMGDGFLIMGMHGHGNIHIKYESSAVLNMCYMLKNEIDELLSINEAEIKKCVEEYCDYPLPPLRIKLCIHWGYVLTSISTNRVIGDCINYTSRILSEVKKDYEQENKIIIITEEYLKCLPPEIKNYIINAGFNKLIELNNYVSNNDNNTFPIYKIPTNDNAFFKLLREGYHEHNLNNDMAKRVIDF